MFVGKKIVSFSAHRLFFPFWRTRKSIHKLLKIFTCTTKLSWHFFHQSQKRLRRYFCWDTKLPSLKFFFELRASFLRFNSFILTDLRCGFFGMRVDEDLFQTDYIAFENNFQNRATLVSCRRTRLLAVFSFDGVSQKWRQLKQVISCDFCRQWDYTFF